MDKLKILFSALTISAFMTGCGGGGGGSTGPTYSGLTTPAAITSTNANELSTKATSATEDAIAQNAANDANPFAIAITPANSEFNPFIIDLTRDIATHLPPNLNLPAGATISYIDLNNYLGQTLFCGGSVSAPDNFGSNGTLNGTITFSNLCVYDDYFGQITINGRVIFTETATEISIRYSNFSINDGVDSATINMTVTCDLNMFSCSITADFVGNDGKTYRIANLTIVGSNTGPYTISATFYHPDHGSVLMSGTGIYYNCSNGYPSAGTINITGANGSSATITFDTCSSYSGSWNDGISSGSFSGNWL